MEAVDRDRLEYPDSDGQPMADNTLQFRWIVVLKENLDAVLSDFVAGDLLWYPVRGEPWVRVAPDVMVAVGRPKGDRGSYRQWEEEGVPPQVVFEVLSPGNAPAAMGEKLAFYDRFGVEEYYVVDPEVEILEVFVRQRGELRQVPVRREHRSPRLGVRFVREDGRLLVFGPDGRRFRTFAEILAERDAVAAERDVVAAERDAVAAERDAVAADRDAVAAERDAASARAARLAERLRALGIDPDDPDAG